MNNFKEFFKNKKITIMGLGLLGRGVGDVAFLAKHGASLIVTDLKTEEQLKESLKKLKKFKDIKYVLGEHKLEDFRNRDMIIKSAGVPLDSIYIKEAKKNNPSLGGASTPVEMDVSLFAKCVPEVMIIGVTGTRGKSMVTAIIYEILKQNEKFLKRGIYLGGNVRGVATLPFIEKVKAGDILICELDSWQLQGFDDAKISPHISVFTSFMPDHMNYYKNSMKDYFNDKANIFKYQTENDVLIIRLDMKKLIFPGHGSTGEVKDIKSKIIVVNKKNVEDYEFIVPGSHQQENLACAVEVVRQFNIPDSKIAQAVKNFKGLEGRLQYIKTTKGVKIYNDNNATTPEATIAGIKALSLGFPEVRLRGNSPKSDFGERRIVLICGGSDKKLSLTNFIKVMNKYCKAIVMIPGTGTDILSSKKLKIESFKVKNLNEAVKTALGLVSRGDIILFSPAFASFGMFNNEYDRGDKFMKIVKDLK